MINDMNKRYGTLIVESNFLLVDVYYSDKVWLSVCVFAS